MGHEYIKESDTFSTSHNGTVPKPSASDVSNNKVLRADGTWVTQSGGGGGGASALADLDDVNLITPSDGQVLQYDNASSKWVNATPSGGSGHNYSTTEQVIGTWIDGKPIYEKVVEIRSADIPNANLKYIAHNISNLKNVIKIQGIVYTQSGDHTILPRVQDNATNANLGIDITTTSILLKGRGINFTSIYSGGYVTLEYTKTTDV